MKHATLFSGIGGPEIAAEWMGWENVFHCEWNEFGKRVLDYYWPEAESYGDITKTDFTIWKGGVDILTGGFPCQPYSVAGKQAGKEDERHLWPEMLRAIREIKPRWVVGENVRGLVSWNGGMVFHEVQTELEAEGYEVLPFLLPAASVNAPHKRDRIWFVAYSSCDGYRSDYQYKKTGCQKNKSVGFEEERERIWENLRGIGATGITSHANSTRLQRSKIVNWEKEYDRIERSSEKRTFANPNSRRQSGKKYGKTQSGFPSEKSISGNWENFPTQSPICDGNDGLSARLDGITFPKWRNESIKAGGNAIVPQVIFEIYKAISEYENLINSK